MNYRADIDGLRAIAVLAVVIFHLGVPGFAGGYIGVDVFFVISGYLITSIICSKLETNSFSIAGFYRRRISRLIPPLLATIAATTIAAAFVLTPHDLISYSRSAVAASFSVSNFVFFSESGYWDTASELKPLLHTWSLGVEEQFYLFWPALLLGLYRIRNRVNFATAMSIVTLVSAIACVAYSFTNASAAFYLLPFRVFQFSAGALVMCIAVSAIQNPQEASKRSSFLLLVAGLTGITFSIFLFDEDTVFPGWAVLLPTLASAAILFAGSLHRGRLSQLVLENRVSRWLGRISYSLYLVHWPIVALYRYKFGSADTPAEQCLLAVAILLATLILHYGVERRFYRRSTHAAADNVSLSDAKAREHRVLLAIPVATTLLALVNASAWLGDGWSWRFPALAHSPEAIEKAMKNRFKPSQTACRLSHSKKNAHCVWNAKNHIVVLGNSHETDGYNFLQAALGESTHTNLILFEGLKKCRIEETQDNKKGVLPLKGSTQRCQNQLDRLFRKIDAGNIQAIFYAANQPYAANKKGFQQILQAAKTRHPPLQVITLGGYINTIRPCANLINQSGYSGACTLPENVTYFADEPEEQPLFDAFRKLETHYIDRVGLLCKNRVLQNCLNQTPDGRPAFYDRNHNSLEFATMSGIAFSSKHPDVLAAFR